MLRRYAETGEYGRNLMAQSNMIEQKYGNGRNRSLNILSKKSSILDYWITEGGASWRRKQTSWISCQRCTCDILWVIHGNRFQEPEKFRLWSYLPCNALSRKWMGFSSKIPFRLRNVETCKNLLSTLERLWNAKGGIRIHALQPTDLVD